MLSASAARGAAFALVLVAATVQAATTPEPLRVGQALPRLDGEFLTGRQAALPAASSGKVALVMIGFTYQSRFPVEAWGGWFRKATAGNPAVTSFEVPMIGGLAKLGKWFIDSGMRKGTPAELHETSSPSTRGRATGRGGWASLPRTRMTRSWCSSTRRASCAGSITARSTRLGPRR